MAWSIDDSKLNENVMRSMPRNVQAKWAIWVKVVIEHGPDELRKNPAYSGFRDEDKRGPWEGYRGSRLSGGWRVLYKANGKKLEVVVERVSNHDYRRKK